MASRPATMCAIILCDTLLLDAFGDLPEVQWPRLSTAAGAPILLEVLSGGSLYDQVQVRRLWSAVCVEAAARG